MRVITKHVERSSQEQNRGSKQITRAIESIAEQVHQLSGAHKEQSKAAAALLASLEQVRKALHGKASDVESLRTELGQLEVSATRLRAVARELAG
jgi:methyl-accepting chemotaxis protein